MALSRQFKALARITAFFGVGWGLVGTALDVLAGGPLLGSILNFGVIFGSAGALSGLATGLVLARGEAGRSVAEVPTWRAAMWGLLAGVGPAGVMVAIITALGTAPGVLVPLLGLGTVSGGLIAGLAASVSIASKREAIDSRDARSELPPG